MNTLEFSGLVWTVSLLAGLVGSLTGLGGGVLLVPLLTLVFGVDVRYAAGASLLSVIATSSGSAVAYVKEGFSNLRVGMLLEVATTAGAIVGAALATRLHAQAIGLIFGVVLLASVLVNLRKRQQQEVKSDPLAEKLHLPSQYPGPDGQSRPYGVRRVPLAALVMFLAGNLSGLLGIGSGALKVLALDDVMGLPFKVSTTTSNFMIGVTAAASAGLYLAHGYFDPLLAAPVILGVLPGALLGARLLPHSRSSRLQTLFNAVVVVLALEMLYQSLTGRL